MRSQTKLEIWLKGVASPEDVALAIQHKVDGIMISNHGKFCGVHVLNIQKKKTPTDFALSIGGRQLDVSRV
jgi:isopentenyl diphosphate isomerase/L-lactate dehydrogenase-like FMN-dependent dehydrogenase